MKPAGLTMMTGIPLLWLSLTPAIQAQIPFGGNINQPAVPSILNLNRAGAPPGLNYFNIVQPQQQFYSQIAQLQQQTTQIQGVFNQGSAASLATGHQVYFGNLSHYYGGRRLGGLGSGSGLAGVRGGSGLAGVRGGSGLAGGGGRPGSR